MGPSVCCDLSEWGICVSGPAEVLSPFVSDLWLGLLLSIPVGVGVNLVSPAFLRSIEKRNEKSARRRERERAVFADEAAQLARDQPAYYSFVLTAILRTTYLGSLLG